MHTFVFALLFICPPPCKPWLLRVLCGAYVGKHVQIGWFTTVMGRHIHLGDYSSIRACTVIRCDGDISLGRYAIVSSFNLIYGAAGLTVGEHSYIGPQCLINNDEDVRLGRYSALGARCMVYTHGSFLPYTEGYWVRFGSVRLGDYVWCAAGVFLHPGVEIGDNSFVNSRSVVTGAIAAGSVVEGNPAQVVGSMERLRRTMTPARLEAATNHMLRHFVELVVQNHWSARVTTTGGGYEFTHRGRSYRLATVGPKQPKLPAGPADRVEIALVSLANWQAPVGALTFDLSTGTMRPHNDPVYHELGQFMQRYYGIQFEHGEHE